MVAEEIQKLWGFQTAPGWCCCSHHRFDGSPASPAGIAQPSPAASPGEWGDEDSKLGITNSVEQPSSLLSQERYGASFGERLLQQYSNHRRETHAPALLTKPFVGLAQSKIWLSGARTFLLPFSRSMVVTDLQSTSAFVWSQASCCSSLRDLVPKPTQKFINCPGCGRGDGVLHI